MSNDAKSVVDMSFGTAETIAFAFPEGGEVVAGLLAGANLVFDLFFPDSDAQTVKEGDAAATKDDLTNAVQDIKAAIDQGGWNNRNDFDTELLAGYSDQIHSNFALAYSDKDVIKIDVTSQNNIDHALESLKSSITSATPLPITFQTIKFIELNPSHRYETFGLYTYAVGMFLLTCKMIVVWDSKNIARAIANSPAVQKNLEAEKNLGKEIAKWAILGRHGPKPSLPKVEIPTSATDKDGNLHDLDGYRKGNIFAKKIAEPTFLPHYIEYAQSVHDDMMSDWTYRDETIKQFCNKLSIVSVGSQYLLHNGNSNTNGMVHSNRDDALRDLQMAQAQIRASLWHSLTVRTVKDKAGNETTHDITKVKLTDIQKLGQTIDKWKEILGNVQDFLKVDSAG